MLSDLLADAMKEIEKYERLSPDTQPERIAEIKEKMITLQKMLQEKPEVDVPPIVRRVAAEEALRSQLGNIVEVIAKLVKLAKSLPEGEIRNQLFDRISELDVIAEVIRKALDSLI